MMSGYNKMKHTNKPISFSSFVCLCVSLPLDLAASLFKRVSLVPRADTSTLLLPTARRRVVAFPPVSAAVLCCMAAGNRQRNARHVAGWLFQTPL